MKNRIIFNHEAFKQIPPLEYWRFIIDGVLQQNPEERGWVTYEDRENGSVKGLLNGYARMLETVNQPLTPNLIKELHKLTLDRVSLSDRYSRKIPAGEYRDEGVRFGVSLGSNATKEGIAELENLSRTKHNFSIGYGRGNSYMVTPISALKIDDEVQNILKEYYQTLDSIREKKLDQKEHDNLTLKAIIKCVKDLEITHPFADGNCRTFCILVFQKLLLDNKLPLTILPDPNCFEGFTIDQMVEQVEQGRKFLQNLSNVNPSTKDLIKQQVRHWETTPDSDWKKGPSPLHLSVTLGIPELVQENLSQVTNVNSVDDKGKTALMLAAARGDREIVELLLKAPSIDRNKRDQFGYTAAMWAAETGQTEIANLLLSEPQKSYSMFSSASSIFNRIFNNAPTTDDSKTPVIDLKSTPILEKIADIFSQEKEDSKKTIALSDADLPYQHARLLSQVNHFLKKKKKDLDHLLYLYSALKTISAPIVAKEDLLKEIKLQITSLDIKSQPTMSPISLQDLRSISPEVFADFSNFSELRDHIKNSAIASEFTTNEYYNVRAFARDMLVKKYFVNPIQAVEFLQARPELILNHYRMNSFAWMDVFTEALVRDGFFYTKDEALEFIANNPQLAEQYNLKPSDLEGKSNVIKGKLLDTLLMQEKFLDRLDRYSLSDLVKQLGDNTELLDKLKKAIPNSNSNFKNWLVDSKNTQEVTKLFPFLTATDLENIKNPPTKVTFSNKTKASQSENSFFYFSDDAAEDETSKPSVKPTRKG